MNSLDPSSPDRRAAADARKDRSRPRDRRTRREAPAPPPSRSDRRSARAPADQLSTATPQHPAQPRDPRGGKRAADSQLLASGIFPPHAREALFNRLGSKAHRTNLQCRERSCRRHDPRKRSEYDHKEVKMWNSVRACLCLMCLAATLPAAEATPIGQSRASVVSSNLVAVAHKCPQGQRWVPAGYAKHGKYRVGHCSPR